VNLLVYAYNAAAPQHERARAWWESSLSGSERVGLAWVTVLGYLRIATSRRAVLSPVTPGTALGHVRSWLERPHVEIVNPGSRHLDLLDGLATAIGTIGTLASDLHLAALAIEHQAELHSNDGDFARFPGLRWRNPLG
jgi:toxin-antitoxin system PIN domain toxin